MRSLLRAFAAGAAAMLTASIATMPASAATVTLRYDFTASNFTAFDNPNNVATPGPLKGSVLITFDPTAKVFDQTTGVNVLNLNVPVNSAVGFTFLPQSGTMQIGGVSNGTNGVVSSERDFAVTFTNGLTGFQFGNASLTTGQAGFQSSQLAVNITAAAVPEPATWALMLGGFGLAGGALRRRSSLQPTPSLS